jgi:hypothetical protein
LLHLNAYLPGSFDLKLIKKSKLGDTVPMATRTLHSKRALNTGGKGFHRRERRWSRRAAAKAPTTERLVVVLTGYSRAAGSNWMFLPQWSVKAEYLFLCIDENVQACGPDRVGVTFCFNQKFEGVHTAKLGVNYHF